MKREIIGGIATLIIGGTGYAISQKAVVSNFANETGMTQEQAEQYVKEAESDLDTFTNTGAELIADGNAVMDEANTLDCETYSYEWETPSLSCVDGQKQMKQLAQSEITLGNCYKSLDTDLGSGANSKIQECITDITAVNSSYDLPIARVMFEEADITEMKNTNSYNKSVLQASLK